MKLCTYAKLRTLSIASFKHSYTASTLTGYPYYYEDIIM